MTHGIHEREPGTSGFDEETHQAPLRDTASQEGARHPGTDLQVFEELSETAGEGLEGARMEELLTPFLALLQPLSPQLDRSSPAYMESAREGMFVNTVTGQIFDGESGIDVVACAREYLYGEWTPRDSGGGFHGTRGPDDPEVRELLAKQGRFKKLATPRGTEFVEQFNVFAWVAPPNIRPETAEQVVLSFTSTKMGVYKRWFNSIGHIRYPVRDRMITPAMWAHVWRLRAVPQKNDKGRFWNYDIRLAAGDNPRDSLVLPSNPLFAMGKEFSELVRSGRAKADFVGAESAGAAGAGRTEDEPPF